MNQTTTTEKACPISENHLDDKEESTDKPSWAASFFSFKSKSQYFDVDEKALQYSLISIVNVTTDALSPPGAFILNLFIRKKSKNIDDSKIIKDEKKKNDNPTEEILGTDLPEEFLKPLPEDMQSELQRKCQASESNTSEKPLTSIESIIEKQEELKKLKQSLSVLIDSILSNPSHVTKWSNAWGQMADWKKWLGGTVITGVPLSVALAAHIPILLGVSGALAAGYGFIGFVFSDHYRSQYYINKLKNGFLSIADILAWTIQCLNEVATKLMVEVQNFQEENKKLRQENCRLSENVNKLCEGVEIIMRNIEVKLQEKELIETYQKELAEHMASLEENASNRGEQLLEGQRQLAELDIAHKAINRKLEQHISELDVEKKSLAEEVERLQVVSQQFRKTVETLSSVCLDNKTSSDKLMESQAHLEKTNAQLIQSKETLDKTNEEIIASQQKLMLGQAALEKTTSQLQKTTSELDKRQFELGETNEKLLHSQKALEKTKEDLQKTHQDYLCALARQEDLMTRLESYQQSSPKHEVTQRQVNTISPMSLTR